MEKVHEIHESSFRMAWTQYEFPEGRGCGLNAYKHKHENGEVTRDFYVNTEGLDRKGKR